MSATADADAGDGRGRVARALAPVRTGRYADLGLFVAVAVGLVATTVHPAGLVVGGLLVGLVAPSLARAFATGLVFGAVTLAAFAAWLAVNGALGPQLAATELLAVSIAAGVGLPTVAAVGVRALG